MANHWLLLLPQMIRMVILMTKDEVISALRSTSDFMSITVSTVMDANWLQAIKKKSHCHELYPQNLRSCKSKQSIIRWLLGVIASFKVPLNNGANCKSIALPYWLVANYWNGSHSSKWCTLWATNHGFEIRQLKHQVDTLVVSIEVQRVSSQVTKQTRCASQSVVVGHFLLNLALYHALSLNASCSRRISLELRLGCCEDCQCATQYR